MRNIINYRQAATPLPLIVIFLHSGKMFDILGKEVATLLKERISPGIYKIKFEGSGFPGVLEIIKAELIKIKPKHYK